MYKTESPGFSCARRLRAARRRCGRIMPARTISDVGMRPWCLHTMFGRGFAHILVADDDPPEGLIKCIRASGKQILIRGSVVTFYQ